MQIGMGKMTKGLFLGKGDVGELSRKKCLGNVWENYPAGIIAENCLEERSKGRNV